MSWLYPLILLSNDELSQSSNFISLFSTPEMLQSIDTTSDQKLSSINGRTSSGDVAESLLLLLDTSLLLLEVVTAEMLVLLLDCCCGELGLFSSITETSCSSLSQIFSLIFWSWLCWILFFRWVCHTFFISLSVLPGNFAAIADHLPYKNSHNINQSVR